MEYKSARALRPAVLRLAEKQHGRVARRQLLALGAHSQTITRWLATGFLFIETRGVYAVGRPDTSRFGTWTAAVLSCGPRAALDGDSAAALWRICDDEGEDVEVVVPGSGGRKKRSGIVVRTCSWLDGRHVTKQRAIAVLSPLETLIAIAPRKTRRQLEAAINKLDALNLIKEPRLRRELANHSGRPGIGKLRAILEPAAFVLTDSQLERIFHRIARSAGLPKPRTQRHFGSDRVDFHWPELGLVVEVDSLTYHRTTIQQAIDRARDHRHFLAERQPLRVTYHQIVHEEQHVVALLAHAARTLRSAA
jgi:very-short-patch-repair endonuclease